MSGGPGADPGSGPTPVRARPTSGAAEWLTTGERGTLLGIRMAFGFARLVGRRAMRPIVSLVAFWYCVFDRRAVQNSRAWVRRVHGRQARFGDVYRHLRAFAQTTLDKVFLLQGQTRGLRFTRTGHDLLMAASSTGRGAMLLGAHVGSYDAMRAGGVGDGLSIRILGFFGNSRMINTMLTRLSPGAAAQVIDIGGDPIDVMSSVREAIERGHLVAAMGDRIGLNAHVVPAPFFGTEAPFAGGPFLMASVLKCPVYLVYGLYREPNHYDLHCELFAERIDLPRRDRAAALQAYVRRYAERLEHYCRLAPDNWFNFHDFWSRPAAPAATVADSAGPPPR